VVAGKTIFSGKGVLQGAVLSGALANLYLTEFDRLCLSHGINLVRYGDDFAIACESWLQANRILDQVTKRPPTDPINSLLSLGYTLLSQQVYSFVQAVGLHTHFGNLHVPRDNHPALVSDLMEEFRAQVVDSFVSYLVNKKILTPEDFTPPDERGGVYLHPDALKKFLKHWEEKLQTEVTHPHTGYKVVYRRCIELQVREYIACLMGEVEVYRPMVWEK
jgi:CRISPR-associated protein Cas1